MTTELSALEKEALKRKEKLKELKRKRETDDNPKISNDLETLPKPKFRSYKPQNDELTDKILQEAKPGDVTAEVKDQLEFAKKGMDIEELDIATLAPRKQDWDLKRDISKKLEYLEKQTQKAIAELIREELNKRKNLAEVANMEMPN